MKKTFFIVYFMLAITCLKAQDIQVEVSHKYPRLVGLANSFVYLYGGMVPAFDLQYQQNRINDGSFSRLQGVFWLIH